MVDLVSPRLSGIASNRPKSMVKKTSIGLNSAKELDFEMCIRDLSFHLQYFWKTIDPAQYIHGRHIDAISEHLQAVSEGHIKKLVINIPPRFSKSTIVSVMWPTWCWLKNPQDKFLTASYVQTLATRDAVRSRRLMQTPLYKQLLDYYYETRLPDERPWKFVGDQNQKTRYENNRNGYRITTATRSALTGEGGDKIIMDDPHNVQDGESAIVRQGTLDWWDESMSTRLNSQMTGSFVVIMQRVHEEDLTGHVLAQNHGYDHLCLPNEYEGKSSSVTKLDFQDWRSEEGELLSEKRMDRTATEDLKKRLGKYAAAGQLQQRPAPRDGGFFKVENFKFMDGIPKSRIIDTVRYWDKAGTEDDGAFSAGVLMHALDDGSFLIANVERGQWSTGTRRSRMKLTAELDDLDYKYVKSNVTIWTEQEPGSGGKESAENTVKDLAGHVIKIDRVTGDKEKRAEPFSIQLENANIFLLKGKDWVGAYVDELQGFPNGKFKDQADATSGAFNKLTGNKKKAGTW